MVSLQSRMIEWYVSPAVIVLHINCFAFKAFQAGIEIDYKKVGI